MKRTNVKTSDRSDKAEAQSTPERPGPSEQSSVTVEPAHPTPVEMPMVTPLYEAGRKEASVCEAPRQEAPRQEAQYPKDSRWEARLVFDVGLNVESRLDVSDVAYLAVTLTMNLRWFQHQSPL